VNTWGIALLDGEPFDTDPRIILMNYIKTSWEEPETPFTVPLTRITIDTKNIANARENAIIIEDMPTTGEEVEIGNKRKRVEEHYRIYVSCKGFSQINNAWIMKKHLDDILGANVTALREEGIDLLKLDDIDRLPNLQEDKFRVGQAQMVKTTTYIFRVRLVYDKVLVES
jgi:hypothetical protein